MTSDDNLWGPPSDESSSASDPWAPEATSSWTGSPPVPPRPPTDDLASPPSAPDTTPVDTEVGRVSVGPVEASTSRLVSSIGRIVAGAVAAVMLGGGAFLALNAGAAEGGAETPEAAFEAAIAAVENEDLIALAEIMAPAERSTVFEAGFDFADELARLNVLDEGVDLSDISGVDVEFTGFEPTAEFPGNGLAHLYAGAGIIDIEIDVAQLPLGSLIADRLDAEQRSTTVSESEVVDPTSTPLVAVQRDGRWYLSLWYTVAENIRLDVDAPLPDLGRRPATIGGDTPEDVVRRMMDDAVALDLRRLIGSMDPEEMAVLYDYSPLFLDEVETAANDVLASARDGGWSWGIDDVQLRSEVDGSTARVFIDAMRFQAADDAGSLIDVDVSTDTVRIEYVTVDDFFGGEVSMVMEFADGCGMVTYTEDGQTETQDLCADADDLSVIQQGLSGGGLGSVTVVPMVTTEVDGRWYLSPIRTGLESVVAALEELDPESLETFVDEILAFGADGLPMIDVGGLAGVGDDLGTDDQFVPIEPAYDHDDLIDSGLDITWGYDLDEWSAATEAEWWAPELDASAVQRGFYATVPGADGGDVALIVFDFADADVAGGAFAAYLEQTGLGSETAGSGQRVATSDQYGVPMFVHLDGSEIVIAGVFGSADDALGVLDQQTAG